MMKKIISSLSLALVFILLMTVSVSAFSSSVLSNPNYQRNIDGVNYVEKTTTENGSTQKIFYGEYNTTGEDAKYEWVIHSIREGTQTTLSTVMKIAQDYESTTGRKVMLAVNGDYFYNTGANVDSYVNNGIVITQGNMTNKHCLGFDNNGKVVVGRLTETDVSVVLYDAEGKPTLYKVDKFNSQPAAGEIAIYNQAGSYTVTNAGAMIVKAVENSNITEYPLYGSDYTMTATGVHTSKSFTLKSGQYAVVYTASHNDVFAKHSYGQPVETVRTPAGSFAGCDWIIGGYDILVDNFTVNTSCHTDNSGNAAAPRTFVGFKADGTGFVCVVDGRGAGGSAGITVNQEAQLASVLGAQYALELDGGGSSTMIVRINDTLTLRNVPSDGSMRKVSNAVLLVEKAEEPAHECEQVCPECGKCLDTSCTESACIAKCEGHIPPHECENVCSECGKCLNTSCTDSACADKCEGHEPVEQPHICEHCPKCGKCLEASCTHEACVDKCEGHESPIIHACESVCPECRKCLNASCTDLACENKCEGHQPHECESKCEKCRRCLDKDCKDDACKNKCQGHKTQPTVEEPAQNPIAAFFKAIFEAIRNFFANLFK